MLNVRSIIPFPRASTALAPSDPFTGLQRDMNRMFGEMWCDFGTDLPTVLGEAATLPRLDVKETAKALHITAELPGVSEKDVEVEITGDLLTIRGEKMAEKVEDEKGYHLSERNYGSFLRSLTLPYEVDPAKIEAKFDRGVLTVIVPKPAAVMQNTRKVPVKAA